MKLRIEPCCANQKPRSVPPNLMPEISGRSTMPKPNETSAQMAMQMLMIRTLAFQYSAGDLLPDMGCLPGFRCRPPRAVRGGRPGV